MLRTVSASQGPLRVHVALWTVSHPPLKGHRMKLAIKLVSAAGALGLAAVGGVTALGSTSASPAARPASVSHTVAAPKATTADPDNVQFGDQTTPDAPVA